MREWLNNVCIQLIDDGASEFFLGGYGAFDRLCADVLRGLKGRFRHIRLVLVLPYLDSALSREGYDETVYPPLDGSAQRRNCCVCPPQLGRLGQNIGLRAQKEKDHSPI